MQMFKGMLFIIQISLYFVSLLLFSFAKEQIYLKKTKYILSKDLDFLIYSFPYWSDIV